MNRGYTVTTGVWARSILQHQYGVDLGKVTWVLSGDEHVAEYQPPSNVVPIEQGKKMEDLLASGEIPAAIGVQIDSPDVKPLIPNARGGGLRRAARARALPDQSHARREGRAARGASVSWRPTSSTRSPRPSACIVDDLAAGRIAEPSADDGSSGG